MKKFEITKKMRARIVKSTISLGLALALIAGPLTPVALAYDAIGSVDDITITENGRTITYYDIYDGQTTGRNDLDNEYQLYKDVVMNKDNFEKWSSLAYNIFESHGNTYWDHAGNGWDSDFGKNHYIDFMSMMQNAKSGGGDAAYKSTGISVANSLNEVQERASQDLVDLIDRDLTADDFMDHHDMSDILTETEQDVVYSTISCIDREGKTPKFYYNSFTIAFYNFQIQVIDDGNAVNSVTGDDTLEEAKVKEIPGFSYKESTKNGSFTTLGTNYSMEDGSASSSYIKSYTEGTTTAIKNSESYSYGEKAGMETKFSAKVPLIAEAEFNIIGELEFSQVIEEAFTKTESTSKTTTQQASIEATLPAHTTAGLQQVETDINLTTTYDCPVAITYDVAIFSMNGGVYRDLVAVEDWGSYTQRSFITQFGNNKDCSDAVENLYQRAIKNVADSSYEETFGYTSCKNYDGDTYFSKLDWNKILEQAAPSSNDSNFSNLDNAKDNVDKLVDRYPASMTGATTTSTSNGVTSEITTPVPLYPIKYIYVNWQLDREEELQVGDSIPIYSYRVEAYNASDVPYYGFVATQGEWKIVDANGIPTTSDVAKIEYDSVTNQQTIVATAPGTVYAKYYIKENYYQTSSGEYSTNANINSPAYKIIVTDKPAQNFEGTLELTGSVEATVNAEPINLNSVDTLELHAYDLTDKEVPVSVSWEARELETAGIKVTPDGVLTVTQPGTFHVRAYCDEVQSEWVEVIAKEPKSLILKETFVTLPTTSSSGTQNPAQTFDDVKMMSRGEFIDLLYQLNGSPDVTAQNVFADVKAKDDYAEALTWAKSQRYINGHTSGNFNPDDGLTNQQLATIICNVLRSEGISTVITDAEAAAVLANYEDGNKVSAWAKKDLAFALQNGYLTVKGNNINANDFVVRPVAANTMVELSNL